ncbi:hypothetical protein [Cytobacillus sp. NCCP-133]|uniref:hypothetical protein n=1 Tax=Cytobacillus sp. NCCP-133 TaxID=766848 RepID=UPI00222E20DC|nr:hypothetical protein [Cytobacillus sp. NCCP-133]
MTWMFTVRASAFALKIALHSGGITVRAVPCYCRSQGKFQKVIHSYLCPDLPHTLASKTGR